MIQDSCPDSLAVHGSDYEVMDAGLLIMSSAHDGKPLELRRAGAVDASGLRAGMRSRRGET